jgi:putative addiction module killer protein
MAMVTTVLPLCVVDSRVTRPNRIESLRGLVSKARCRSSVGTGVFEYRIDFGPGYRVYFGKAGDAVVILLCGGTKKRQDGDIAMARERWVDYKKRKAEEK